MIRVRVVGAGEVAFEPRLVAAAGYTGRDRASVRAHIAELAAQGIRPPERIPMLYHPLPAASVSTNGTVRVAGPATSGEAEPVLLVTREELLVTVGSDHTDRELEKEDVLSAKQACGKAIGSHVWRFDEVAPHWGEIELRSWVSFEDVRLPYQEGTLAQILPAEKILELVRAEVGGRLDDAVVFCGTLPLLENRFVPGERFEAEIRDPVLGRALRCSYAVMVTGGAN